MRITMEYIVAVLLLMANTGSHASKCYRCASVEGKAEGESTIVAIKKMLGNGADYDVGICKSTAKPRVFIDKFMCDLLDHPNNNLHENSVNCSDTPKDSGLATCDSDSCLTKERDGLIVRTCYPNNSKCIEKPDGFKCCRGDKCNSRQDSSLNSSGHVGFSAILLLAAGLLVYLFK